MLLIKNGTVFYKNKLSRLDVLINDQGLVQNIDANINESRAQIINAHGMTIIPGLIDVHVHLREPGFEYKETIKTGSQAAAAGGFTTVCCMPNLNPVTDNLLHLEYLKSLIKKDAVINVIPYVSITLKEQGHHVVNMESLAPHCFAFSDDGVGVANVGVMRQAMEIAQTVGKPIVAHCELHSDKSVDAEECEIDRDLKLAKETGCQYHICHVSTKNSLALIRKYKTNKISCEVTPHHLLINQETMCHDGSFKMNPPIRPVTDQAAMVQGLVDGTIDMIVTDHAPHSIVEKTNTFDKSLNGVVGLETALSLIYTYFVKNHKISFARMILVMC
ncbi:dihydroorotase [Bacilli bacterium]|nr:dihydroorotase [Bacilli bacterium]